MFSKEAKEYEPQRKLICDWSSKETYWIHSRPLKTLKRHIMHVTKFHSVVSFKQKSWLETFNSFNKKKRAETKSMFEQEIQKLLKNAI